MIPHCDLYTGLSQVLWSEPVVHHGVIKHRVGRPLHHSGFLSVFPACVRKHSAAAEGDRSHNKMISKLVDIFNFLRFKYLKREKCRKSYHFTNGSMIRPLTGGRFLQSFTQICTSPVSILDVILPMDVLDLNR